jgi:hypothetical protein
MWPPAPFVHQGRQDAPLPVNKLVTLQVLPDKTPWMPELFRKIVDLALDFPQGEVLAYNAANPNRRRLWLVPALLLVQIGVKYLLERVIEMDGCNGDRNGDFGTDVRKCVLPFPPPLFMA